jgi:cephalosporin hydroxylase
LVVDWKMKFSGILFIFGFHIHCLSSQRITLSSSSSSSPYSSQSHNLLLTFRNHRGHVADEWIHYLAEYQELFHKFVLKPINLLEIGVSNGGMLQIWKEYFGPNAVVSGIDTNPIVCDMNLGEGIQLFCLDSYTSDTALSSILEDQKYEIIIDDGSHRSPDVIKLFILLFERVTPGGYYVIEDTYYSYWSKYGLAGGFRKTGTTMDYFSHLTDLLNVNHFPFLTDFIENLTEFEVYCSQWISSIQFLDSLIIIKKSRTQKVSPLKRVVVGNIAPIARVDQAGKLGYENTKEIQTSSDK